MDPFVDVAEIIPCARGVGDGDGVEVAVSLHAVLTVTCAAEYYRVCRGLHHSCQALVRKADVHDVVLGVITLLVGE